MTPSVFRKRSRLTDPTETRSYGGWDGMRWESARTHRVILDTMKIPPLSSKESHSNVTSSTRTQWRMNDDWVRWDFTFYNSVLTMWSKYRHKQVNWAVECLPQIWLVSDHDHSTTRNFWENSPFTSLFVIICTRIHTIWCTNTKKHLCGSAAKFC